MGLLERKVIEKKLVVSDQIINDLATGEFKVIAEEETRPPQWGSGWIHGSYEVKKKYTLDLNGVTVTIEEK